MPLNRRKVKMNDGEERESLVKRQDSDQEESKRILFSDLVISKYDAVQVIPPFFLAGLGTLAAGILLNAVKEWPVFKEISELFVLIPALLGLKGNLAMTLASRLSTEAHRGIASPGYVVKGYLSLDQAQALIVGLLSSLVAAIIGVANHSGATKMLILCSTAVFSASLVSIVLGGLMCSIVIGSTRCSFNPDNVATPIAASLGDVVTLGIIAFTANILYSLYDSVILVPICISIILFFVLIIPPLLVYAWNNPYARPAALQGWVPILSAMIISSLVGFVMSKVSKDFSAVLGFLPIINGIGGNLVSIQASRLSTHYNIHGIVNYKEIAMSIFLLGLVLPGEGFILALKELIEPQHLSLAFYVAYFLSAFLQVTILLCISYFMVMMSPYARGLDPDLYAIPLLTALGDFFGTGLLTLSVLLIDSLGAF